MQAANAAMIGKPFKATRKKLYTIHWRFGQIGERVYNRLEDVWYTVDENRCIILKGTAGEEWAVDCAKLMKTYNTGYDADHLGHLYTKHTVGKVVDKTLACGNNQLVNWANVTVKDNLVYKDDASVLVVKDDETCENHPNPEPTPDTPGSIVDTGAGTIAFGAIGAGAAVTTLGYYIASRKKSM